MSWKDWNHWAGESMGPADRASRRRFLFGGLTIAGGVIGGWRFIAFPLQYTLKKRPIPHDRKALSPQEWVTLDSLFECFAEEEDGRNRDAALVRADQFIANFTWKERLELAGALFFVEQSAGGFLSRFSQLNLEERKRCLSNMRVATGLAREVYIGMKELAALVFYTDRGRWREIGYTGPMVPEVPDSGSVEREQLLRLDSVLARHWGKS
jgi:hypothetical protein